MNTLISDLAKGLIKILILIYRYSLSLLIGRQCRFAPSCSEYTLNAVESFGAVRGLYLGTRRIMRCRRGQPHGFDPVPENFSWKPDLEHLHQDK